MKTLIFTSLFFLSFSLRAEDSSEAVRKTQALIKDPKQRQEAINQSDEAKKTDAHIDQITGGDTAVKEDLYELAAQVLGNMENMSPEEMEKIIEKSKNDPEGFARSLTPEQRKKLQEIAERLPASKYKKP